MPGAGVATMGHAGAAHKPGMGLKVGGGARSGKARTALARPGPGWKFPKFAAASGLRDRPAGPCPPVHGVVGRGGHGGGIRENASKCLF